MWIVARFRSYSVWGAPWKREELRVNSLFGCWTCMFIICFCESTPKLWRLYVGWTPFDYVLQTFCVKLKCFLFLVNFVHILVIRRAMAAGAFCIIIIHEKGGRGETWIGVSRHVIGFVKDETQAFFFFSFAIKEAHLEKAVQKGVSWDICFFSDLQFPQPLTNTHTHTHFIRP